MEDWVVCRKERPARARHAVRELARKQVAEGGQSGYKDVVAEAVADAAFGFADGELSRYPGDRLVGTWVSDLVADVLDGRIGQVPSGRWRRSGHNGPSPPEGWTWQRLLDAFHVASTSWARHRSLRGSVSGDLARAAISRLFEERLRDVEVRYPLAWAYRVFASVVRDSARGKADGPLPPRIESREIVARDLATLRAASSPEEMAILRELADRAPAYLDRLPPPYHQIAHLQYLWEWSRREIGTWLATWRPIKDEGIRTLFRRTHQMLRAIGDGNDPRTVWPGKYNPKKNPWISCPPLPRFRL